MPGACAGWRPPVPGLGRGSVGVPRCPALVVRRLASPGARPGGERRHRRGALWWRAGAGLLGWPMPGSCTGRRPPVPGSRIVPRAAVLPGAQWWRAGGRCPRVADARIVRRLASPGARLPDRAPVGGTAGRSPVAGQGPVPPPGGRCPHRGPYRRPSMPGSLPDGVPRCPVPVVPRTASPPGVHPWWAISPRPWWWRRSTGVRCTAMRAASSPSRPPTWASRSRRRWCISASGLSSVHRATRSASG